MSELTISEKFRPTKKFSIGAIITTIVLLFWSVLQIFPIYWMLTFSLKENSEIFGANIIGLPHKWLFSNYTTALQSGNMFRYLLNSVIVTGATILITVVAATAATYALTRMVWHGRRIANALFMLGITLPINAVILPIFLALSKVHLTNSYWALIIPYSAFALSMSIMIASSFMEGIPLEIEEAACLDGCSVYGIFWHVILPMMKPALSTLSIFIFLQAWNELMYAVIFISDSAFRTVTVGIQNLSGSFTTDWGPIGAALVIATFPVLIIYAFFSSKIQEGLVAGAVKG
jgi:raffinose/stachyose/melibiose transport system permease protein